MSRGDSGPERADALLLGEEDLAFATDLYQLTMAAAYHARWPGSGEGGTGDGGRPRGVFELFVRRLPPNRRFLVFAGLDQALASLEALRFSGPQLDYLASLPAFAGVDPAFFELLATFRFRGGVRAVPEGTVFFPGEPVLQVSGDLIEAQIVETLLLSIVNFQTAIASKAARLRLAGPRVSLADFGGRRAHGPQAATWVARAAYLAGFDGTSNVLAGQRLGIPVVGTMAHSYVLSFGDESEAFSHFARTFPGHVIHLVDTYDSLEGTRRALASGEPFQGVRLDSGDLGALSRKVRALLDQAGRHEVQIYASGDVDEYIVDSLLAQGAPIDAFGVGTQLATSADAPHLGGVYKLVEVVDGGRRLPRFKGSTAKETYPWRKQVLRHRNAGGLFTGDRLVRAEAADARQRRDEEPLLRPVMEEGRTLERAREDLGTLRTRCAAQLASLPEELRSLAVPAPSLGYPVAVAADLVPEGSSLPAAEAK